MTRRAAVVQFMNLETQQIMKRLIFLSLTLAVNCLPAWAGLTLAAGGKARCVIIQSAEATAPERHAVAELKLHLEAITGAKFDVRDGSGEIPKRAIIVGQGAAARSFFPGIDFAALGSEELAMRVKGGRLLLAGGRPRGTIYAVNRFLQEQCGVRWWTPWATNIPHRATLRIPDLNLRGKPAFEYRAPFWFQGFDPLWKARNGVNSEWHNIPADLGGCLTYKGHAHTFYPLVPPEKYFAPHPEWYSLIDGKRTYDRAQLCLSNPELRDFVVGRVKEWLRESPDAAIISVTQNDWRGQCQCANCKAIDDAEGSPSGSMLAFVNYVAERIEPEFPNVAVDTFAYDYSRKPPKTLKPRPNVIVRLCSIECDFREPLDHPSNAAFLADLEGWSKICRRLYIWDYTTDFRHYVNPHPNWFTLGANMRLFQKDSVRGVFEQGAYQDWGGEMGEMRSWVLAQLLWNPRQDDRALVREFLDGYYGRAAAKPIARYFELMRAASKDFYLRCFLGKDPPHLWFKTLGKAERLWQEAELAAATDPDLLARVRMGHLPVRYAFLREWPRLRYDCWEQNGEWPLPESRRIVADEFEAVCNGVPDKNWTRVNLLNEHGFTVGEFLKPFALDPPGPPAAPPPTRLSKPLPPADLKGVNLRGAVDLQDNLASLTQHGELAEVRPDPAASDCRAVWMSGNHTNRAFRIFGSRLPAATLGKRWNIFFVARVDKTAKAAANDAAFRAGVNDDKSKKHPVDFTVRIGETGNGYRSFLIGTVEMNRDRDIWAEPPGSESVQAVWIDRVILVPARSR